MYIDSLDPSSAFFLAEAPPFLSDLRGQALSTDGGEQKGREQCGDKD